MEFSEIKLSQQIYTLVHSARYEEAIDILKPLAEKGNGEAQNAMGEIYHFGPKKIKDYTKAKEWYLKAVENGNGEAANHLGRLYINGEGVRKDEKKAKYWYKTGMLLRNKEAEENYRALKEWGKREH